MKLGKKTPIFFAYTEKKTKKKAPKNWDLSFEFFFRKHATIKMSTAYNLPPLFFIRALSLLSSSWAIKRCAEIVWANGLLA